MMKHVESSITLINGSWYFLWIGIIFISSLTILSPLKADAGMIANDKEKIPLVEAIMRISLKYHVYPTYVRTLLADIWVQYEKDEKSDINLELKELLKGTSLEFKVFEDQYFILYKEIGRASCRERV